MISMSILSMMWWRNNIMILLLNMELIMISIFFMITYMFSPFSSNYLMIMLTLMVMASSMGLSLMVMLMRSFNSTNSIQMWSLTFDKIYHNINTNYNTKHL